jgi:transcriptional regulator with XRE-family HTH domain
MTSKTFGKFVRQQRKYYWPSLEFAAREAGISKGNLSKIENGKGDPSLSTIMKLSEALNFTVNFEGLA